MTEQDSLLNLFRHGRVSRDTYRAMKSKGYTDATVFPLSELKNRGLLL